ncbi:MULTISPECIES: hypothetical protein [Halorubrum]|uniref:Methanogenesis regulatory protein FilR1 middle domain-containing protein n=1 Tax=Halorubrum ruber TaxID=2982524 RepID=A0A8T8LQG0_9EURY|nr:MULTISPECIES: hypothetical protein [Halorubrum]QUO49075.1 hypothetical protein J7656_07010 [Halorubrum ruber]
MSDDETASPAAVLRSLVARAVDADPASLDDRVEVVERGDEPDADDAAGTDASTPAGRLAELVGEADSVVAVVPRFDADLARRLNASLAASGSDAAAGGDVAAGDDAAAAENDAESESSAPREVRVVFTGSASDRLAGATGPVVRRALADRGVDTYRHEGESPVAVVLAEDRAVVGVIDGDGVAALLWTGDPAVREWAAATCRRYLDDAKRVTEG